MLLPIADEGNQPSSNSHENNESSTNSEVVIPFKPGSIEEPEVLPKELVTHPDGGWCFDPGQDEWLKGHRPSGGISVIPMGMLLDLIAREVGSAPLDLVDFKARNWVRMDRTQRSG